MAIGIRRAHPTFVGEVSGIDITQPLNRAQVEVIEAGMHEYAVLVFHDQPLTDQQQVDFTRNFGELEVTLAGQMAKPEERRFQQLELGDISNLDQGRGCAPAMTAGGCMRWRTCSGIPTHHSARLAPATRCCTRV